MSIRVTTAVVCDHPDCTATVDADPPYSVTARRVFARNVARRAGWRTGLAVDYCPTHAGAPSMSLKPPDSDEQAHTHREIMAARGYTIPALVPTAPSKRRNGRTGPAVPPEPQNAQEAV